MRQLKNLMKAKKPMWNCGECKCITLQCWRENDEFCNCGTSSEGLGVEYSFKNWNGKVLKQGSIEEGTTPTPPADPTREATAEYTYTFAGWDPEVGPINEDTVYTATYTATVNEYTVSIASEDIDKGTVNESSVADIPYGTKLSTDDNVLTIGEGTSAVEVTATAEDGYVFSSWGEVPATVTGNTSITATFGFGPLENLKLVTMEGDANLFCADEEDSNYVELSCSYDQELGEWSVDVYPTGLFYDDFFVVDGDNVWETALGSLDHTIATAFIGEYVEGGEAVAMPTEIFTAAQTLYATPSTANASALTQAITDYYTPDEPEDPEVVVAEFEDMLEAQSVETVQSWLVEDPQENLPISITYDGKTRNCVFAQTSESSGIVFYNSLTYEYSGSVALETEGGETSVVVGECSYIELEENE